MKTVSAIIPIRYSDCFDTSGKAKKNLKGAPLWRFTFDSALACTEFTNVIVAYDDARFESELASYPGFKRFLRPPNLSRSGVTVMDVMMFVANQFPKSFTTPDYLMLLEITHPLRPKNLLKQLVDAINANPVDSLVTTYPVSYNFWRQEENGSVERIEGHGDQPGVKFYQEMLGIGSMFSFRDLERSQPFGDSINLAPIGEFWATVDTRDADDLWLAEKLLER